MEGGEVSVDKCCKPDWNGRCCCNCKHQAHVMKHPWNKGKAKGEVTEQMGFACAPPDFIEDGIRKVIYMDSQHGLCEMHLHQVKR